MKTLSRNNKGQYKQRDSLPKYDGFSVYADAKGYPIIYIAGKEIKLHVYVWEKQNGNKPLGMQVHHIDGCKSNYAIDNLMLVSQSDHSKIHAGWVRNEAGDWTHKPCNQCKKILPLDAFYKRKGYTPSALCKACHCVVTSTKNMSKERREKVRLYKQQYHIKQKGRAL